MTLVILPNGPHPEFAGWIIEKDGESVGQFEKFDFDTKNKWGFAAEAEDYILLTAEDLRAIADFLDEKNK